MPPDSCDIVAIGGELDTYAFAWVAPAVLDWIDTTSAQNLHVDLSELVFLDGRGIELLVRLHEHGNRGARALGFERPSHVVMHLIDLLDLRGIFRAHLSCTHPPSPELGLDL